MCAGTQLPFLRRVASGARKVAAVQVRGVCVSWGCLLGGESTQEGCQESNSSSKLTWHTRIRCCTRTSVRKLHPRNFGSGSYVVSSAKLHRKFHLLNRAVGTYGSVRCRAARNRAIFKLSCEWFCRFATLKRFNHGGSAIFFCQQGGTLFLEFCSCSSFFGR